MKKMISCSCCNGSTIGMHMFINKIQSHMCVKMGVTITEEDDSEVTSTTYTLFRGISKK